MGKHFGTDGVRGVANETLTVDMAYRIGRFLGQYPSGKKNKVLLCRDTRLSGEMLSASLTCGLLSSGADVYDEIVSTTPSISYLVRQNKFDFGVMISASHNPFYDNGIKVFNAEGEKLQDEIEDKIEVYMDAKEDNLPFKTRETIGRYYPGEPLKESYISWLISKKEADYSKLRVLVDCANGSASFVAPRLYKLMGLKATFIHADPDGVNINADCGSTHLKSLQKAFQNGKYDLGFAFDGDSDRFMAIAPDGRVIDGDAMIFLNALLFKKQNRLRSNSVVITVMSNFGLRKALESNGINYDTVAVGDKNVQARLKEKNLMVGGEQSGHVIFLDDLNTGDGLLSSIKLMNLFINDPDIFAKLPEFKVYPQVLQNISFKDQATLQKVSSSKALEEFVHEKEASLGGKGRVLVRKSGTEPLLRIMAEALDEKACNDVVRSIADFALKEAE